MRASWTAVLVCAIGLAACDVGGEAQEPAREGTPAPAEMAGGAGEVIACTVAGASVPLADEVRETSGLALSGRSPGLFWTHNDAGNDARLFAVDAHGQVVQQVRIAGAEAVDWEDIESGACEQGHCLYVGDIGDNDAERERITVYRLAEPGEGEGQSGAVEALHARYPDGPRDAESLFRLPSGDLFVVTKGREGPIELYRFAASQQQAGSTATLERIKELFPEPQDDLDRISAATASQDGRWVAIRSYRNLFLYEADALVDAGAGEPAAVVDTGDLGQPQGESVAIDGRGVVWLTSEAENKDSRPSLGRVECDFSGG